MALELGLWLIVAIGSLILYFGGMYWRLPHLFVLGCALMIGSGALLWGFDGLLLDRELQSVSDAGVLTYTDIAISMTNLGLQMLVLAFVSIPIISMLVIKLDSAPSRRSSPFHY